jgi:hypothetical protein
LAGFAVFILGLTALGVVCFGASFADDNTVTARLAFIGLGAALLIWPAVTVRSLIRRKRAGTLSASLEELDQMRAQRAAWRAREWQRPMSSKIISTAVTVFIYGLWWIRVTLHHAQHPHESWMIPAMWTPALIYLLWVQFRRPKNAA